MTAREFLKGKGINYNHEATGMSAYVQNAGSTINAMEQMLEEYHQERMSNRMKEENEKLGGFLLKVVKEFDKGEVTWELIDEIKSKLEYNDGKFKINSSRF